MSSPRCNCGSSPYGASLVEKAQKTVQDATWSAQVAWLKVALIGAAGLVFLDYHDKKMRSLRRR